jgi:hypothetical protein
MFIYYPEPKGELIPGGGVVGGVRFGGSVGPVEPVGFSAGVPFEVSRIISLMSGSPPTNEYISPPITVARITRIPTTFMR